MNAGGVDKACKSCENVTFCASKIVRSSGERVSNTWITNLRDGYNPAKAGLIPDSFFC